MRLWRLSGTEHAQAMDGGYGLLFDGRWNSVGHAVTYCSTSPSLCVLEKLVHIEDPSLLPELVTVTYEVPDTLPVETVDLAGLPADWPGRQRLTQRRGVDWHQARSMLLLRVPPAIIPLAGSPDEALRRLR
jgi:RES domain-containing protein